MPSAEFEAAVKASRQLTSKPGNDELLEVRCVSDLSSNLHSEVLPLSSCLRAAN